MKHSMRLQEKPFQMIKSGVKTIELRLYDEKRKAICIGDKIEFTNTLDKKTLLCGVVALHVFASFEELYNNLPLLQCGYTDADIATASPADMQRYYSKEEQKKYGVVGIQLTLL